MPHSPDDLEKYLREFQPRRPRALQESTRHESLGRVLRIVIASAALILLSWAASRLPLSDVPDNPDQAERRAAPSLSELTRMAMDNPADFESFLVQASRASLPGFREDLSALRLLAKE